MTNFLRVTPFLGVWIEIHSSAPAPSSHQSLPSWECGLKLITVKRNLWYVTSLPSRECGLKLHGIFWVGEIITSLPSRECGLKYVLGGLPFFVDLVTPFLGVWIEIIRNRWCSCRLIVTPFLGVRKMEENGYLPQK